MMHKQSTDLVVLWRVYEHCNLACAFCGYSRELDRARAVAQVDRTLAFARLLAEYQRSHRRRVLVSWLGGEPLLWRDLPVLSQAVKQLGLGLSVTTNGVPLASPTVRHSLIADYQEVTISVDGVGAFHDWCRNAPGLFEQIAANVAALDEENKAAGSPLRIKVNTILMCGNIADFEALCRQVAGWSVQELTFNQLGGRDRPEFYPANRLLPEQVERFAGELPGIRQRMQQLGLAIRGGERYLQRIASTSRGEAIAVDDCQPGRQFLFVDERGFVSPCSFTAESCGVSLDELQTAEDVAQLPVRFAQRRKSEQPPACHDCHSTQVFQKFACS
jgi:MoaA/NifB/PqqE/SkfB family radical SAM enzyme